MEEFQRNFVVFLSYLTKIDFSFVLIFFRFVRKPIFKAI